MLTQARRRVGVLTAPRRIEPMKAVHTAEAIKAWLAATDADRINYYAAAAAASTLQVGASQYQDAPEPLLATAIALAADDVVDEAPPEEDATTTQEEPPETPTAIAPAPETETAAPPAAAAAPVTVPKKFIRKLKFDAMFQNDAGDWFKRARVNGEAAGLWRFDHEVKGWMADDRILELFGPAVDGHSHIVHTIKVCRTLWEEIERKRYIETQKAPA